MRRDNTPTLQDIAREVGVSAMTVSVVLHGSRSSTRVSDATRARIVEAAARLRYRPNAVARGLNRRRMNTLGVVAAIEAGELNLYFLEVLNGILETAAQHGQNTTVFSVTNWQTDEAKILHFCDGRVDGMILLAPHLTTPTFAESLLRHAPFVTIHSSYPISGTNNLDVDNAAGAYAVVQQLIASGHRDIAFLPGGGDLPGVWQREAGYRRALTEAGIPYNPGRTIPGNFSAWSGRKRMEQMLADAGRTPLPTAIFCASDAIASGSMEVLASHGLRVPEDISIVGFDDTLAARMTTPPLTTVRQPFHHMGQRAVALLLQHITEEVNTNTAFVADTQARNAPRSGSEENVRAPGPTPDVPAPLPPVSPGSILPYTEILPFELMIRKSVGPPRTQESILLLNKF